MLQEFCRDAAAMLWWCRCCCAAAAAAATPPSRLETHVLSRANCCHSFLARWNSTWRSLSRACSHGFLQICLCLPAAGLRAPKQSPWLMSIDCYEQFLQWQICASPLPSGSGLVCGCLLSFTLLALPSSHSRTSPSARCCDLCIVEIICPSSAIRCDPAPFFTPEKFPPFAPPHLCKCDEPAHTCESSRKQLANTASPLGILEFCRAEYSS
jgi:hypothetical protein